MEKVNNITLITTFISFIALTLILYFSLLKYKKIFNLRNNIIIIIALIAFGILVPLIASWTDANIDTVMILGVISSAPLIAYATASTKVFLNKMKNTKNINTKNIRKVKNENKN